MSASGESTKGYIRPYFDRSIMMDFQGAKLSSDTRFLLMRVLDQRHNVIAPIVDIQEDSRSVSHIKHSMLDMTREFHLKGEDVKRSMEWVIRKSRSGATRYLFTKLRCVTML